MLEQDGPRVRRPLLSRHHQSRWRRIRCTMSLPGSQPATELEKKEQHFCWRKEWVYTVNPWMKRYDGTWNRVSKTKKWQNMAPSIANFQWSEVQPCYDRKIEAARPSFEVFGHSKWRKETWRTWRIWRSWSRKSMVLLLRFHTFVVLQSKGSDLEQSSSNGYSLANISRGRMIAKPLPIQSVYAIVWSRSWAPWATIWGRTCQVSKRPVSSHFLSSTSKTCRN